MAYIPSESVVSGTDAATKQQAQQLANEWINRKMAGQRVVTVYYGNQPTQEQVYATARYYYNQYNQNPLIREKLDTASQLKQQAFSQGFDNVEPYVEKNIQLFKKIPYLDQTKQDVTPSPTQTEEALQMSLLPELRDKPVEEVRKELEFAKQPVQNPFQPITVPKSITDKYPLPDQKNEIYSPSLGGYTQSLYFGQGTVTTRTPTQEERLKIEGLSSPAQFFFGTDKKQGNILTANIDMFKAEEKRFEKTSQELFGIQKTVKGIEETSVKDNIFIGTPEVRTNSILKEIEQNKEKIKDYESKYIVNNQFIGNKKQYEEYSKLFDKQDKLIKQYEQKQLKLNEEYNKYNQLYFKEEGLYQTLESTGAKITGDTITRPTIKAGLFGLSRDVQPSSVSGVLGAVTLTASSTLGIGTEKLLGKLGVKESYKSINVTEPSFGTIELNPITGKPKQNIKEIKVLQSITPKQIGEGISTATEFGAYAIPYFGGALFTEQVVSDFRSSGNVLKYVQENPLQATIIVGGAAYLGGRLAQKPFKSFITKEVEGGTVVTSKGKEFLDTRLRISTYNKGKGIFNKGLKFEKIPAQTGYFKIVQKELKPLTKPTSPQVSVNIPTTESTLGGRTIQTYEGIKGSAITTKVGRGTQIETIPSRSIFAKRIRISKDKIEINSPQPKIIFEPVNPYTKSGQQARKEAIEFLVKRGVKEKEAKKLIALQRPVVIESNINLGGKVTLFETGTSKTDLKGSMISYFKSEKIGNIPTRKGKPKWQSVDLVGTTPEIATENQLTVVASNVLSPRKSIFNMKETQYGIASTKELEPIEIGDETFRVYKGKSLTRSFPQGRKTFVSDTTTIYARQGEAKVKFDLDELTRGMEGTSGTKIFKGGGKRSSKEYLDQLYSQSQKQLSETITPLFSNPQSTIIKPSFKQTFPSTSIMESQFAGKGLYEFTATQQTRVPLISTQSSMNLEQKNIMSDSLMPKQKLEFKTTQFQKTKQEFEFTPTLSQLSIQEITPILETKLKQEQKQEQKQLLNLKQEQKQELMQRTTQPLLEQQALQRISITKPIKPIVPIIVPSIENNNLMPKLKSMISSGSFEVFVRKAGKDISLGKKASKESAVSLLKRNLSGTLRASGYIKQGKQKLSFSELGIKDTMFRPSKIESYRVVQRKTKRLGRKSEVSELQFFKKTKKTSGGLLGR